MANREFSYGKRAKAEAPKGERNKAVSAAAHEEIVVWRIEWDDEALRGVGRPTIISMGRRLGVSGASFE